MLIINAMQCNGTERYSVIAVCQICSLGYFPKPVLKTISIDQVIFFASFFLRVNE